MKKTFKIILVLYTIFILVITYKAMNGSITFGHGLGDLYYLFFGISSLVVAFTIFIINRFKSKKNNFPDFFGVLLLIIAIVILTLKMTILRGPE